MNGTTMNDTTTNGTTMNEYRNTAFLSATDVLAKLESGELNHTDVATAIMDQIESVNPQINAYDSTAETIESMDGKPLKGLPVSVKDQIHVAGMPCNFGLDRSQPGLCEETAVPIQRLLAAGASIIGKTNLPPFAMDYQSFNGRVGRTNNPWNTAFTAGGSSGGGAAAVAAGLSYLDIGADLAGSLRIPAAFCGVFSLLPSEGALESDHMMVGQGSLPHFARMGPLARTVDDLMVAWKFLSGTEHTQSQTETTKIAIWEPSSGESVDEHTLKAFSDARALLDAGGLEVRSTRTSEIVDDHSHRCFGEIMGYDTAGLVPSWARLLGRVFGRSAAKRSPSFLRHVHSGQARNASRYDEAKQRRLEIQSDFDATYANDDALLLPVSQIAAFKHRTPSSDRNGIRDYKEPFLINGSEVNYFDALTSFTTPISLVGNPVVTIPIGLDARGLPVGAQLVGKRGGDWQLLETAKRLAWHLQPVSLAAKDI